MTGARVLLLVAACAAVLAASPAPAQSPADSAAAPASAAPTAAPRAAPDEAARDRDRFELGAAVVSGPFDVLGTFGYHRLLRRVARSAPFESWLHLELAGGSAGYLREGAASVAFLLRPTRMIHQDWPIRPILEFGPAGHLVFQVAEIRGFEENAFHTHAYLKTHAYAGFDIPLSSRVGLVARGRLTVPTHKALDYAQIALFLR